MFNLDPSQMYLETQGPLEIHYGLQDHNESLKNYMQNSVCVCVCVV